MMGSIALWLAAMVFMFLEGAILGALGIEQWSLQLGLIVVCYLGMRRDFESSAWLLAALLLPLEWTTGGPMGGYSLGAVVIFLLLRLVGSQLEARWSAWKAMFCAIAVLLHHLVVAGYWLMFAPDSPIVTAIFATMFGAAFGAGIVSLPLGWLFARLESQFTPRDGTQGLSFG